MKTHHEPRWFCPIILYHNYHSFAISDERNELYYIINPQGGVIRIKKINGEVLIHRLLDSFPLQRSGYQLKIPTITQVNEWWESGKRSEIFKLETEDYPDIDDGKEKFHYMICPGHGVVRIKEKLNGELEVYYCSGELPFLRTIEENKKWCSEQPQSEKINLTIPSDPDQSQQIEKLTQPKKLIEDENADTPNAIMTGRNNNSFSKNNNRKRKVTRKRKWSNTDEPPTVKKTKIYDKNTPNIFFERKEKGKEKKNLHTSIKKTRIIKDEDEEENKNTKSNHIDLT